MTRPILVAGATGIIMLWSWPADGARRDEDTRGFCQGAPDLCVFVCRGGCAGMSSDYICESRRGRLVVLEGGEQSYFEEDFSLCWHRSRPPDEPLPDPENEHVPGWPGSDEGAMCMACKRQGDWCAKSVNEHLEICIRRNEAHYRHWCKRTLAEHGEARGRNGKTFGFSDWCEVVIRNLEMYEERRGGERGGELGQKENPQVQRCKDEVVGHCLADYSQDHPDEHTTNSIGLEVGEYFKVNAGHSSTVTWGGKIGFETACLMASGIVSDECIEEEVQCYRDADKKTTCSRYRNGGSR